MKEVKRIKVPPENLKKMMKIFNCKKPNLYLALKFHNEDSPTEKKIRHVALTEMGGVLLTYKE